MVIVLGVLASLFLAVLVVGAVLGRVRINGCCPPASADLRMRGAFDPADQTPPPHG